MCIGWRRSLPPGATPERDLIVEAQDCLEEGAYAEADEVLDQALALDLRYLDAHAMLGERHLSSWFPLARHHFELGVAIGSLTVGEDFDGVLPATTNAVAGTDPDAQAVRLETLRFERVHPGCVHVGSERGHYTQSFRLHVPHRGVARPGRANQQPACPHVQGFPPLGV